MTENIQLVSEVNLIDRIKFLKSVPDYFFDLVVDDPPFGIGCTWKKSTSDKFYTQHSGYKNNVIPPRRYFDLLRAKSKNQIIWGANYYVKYPLPTRGLFGIKYTLPKIRCQIVN